jgi:hypothetical protein
VKPNKPDYRARDKLEIDSTPVYVTKIQDYHATSR